jgi:phosphoglycolate phosphatase-like HAD superfamily hydrolase
MHLILFDIDGTLIDSNHLEGECFIHAMRKIFGITKIERDWGYYHHVTDRGIAKQLVEEQLERSPTESELDALEKIFLEYLVPLLQFQEINHMPGVNDLLLNLMQKPNIALGLATGSFKRSAELKLQRANLNLHHFPLASCNDHFNRTQIIRRAIRRSQKYYHTNHFQSVTYVGDGFWDYQAATALKINFIGIHNTSLGHPLSAEKGAQVVPDFKDIEKFLSYVFGNTLKL